MGCCFSYFKFLHCWMFSMPGMNQGGWRHCARCPLAFIQKKIPDRWLERTCAIRRHSGGRGRGGPAVAACRRAPSCGDGLRLAYGMRLGKSLLASAGVGYDRGYPEAELGTVWETGKHCWLGLQCRMGGAGIGYGGASLTWKPGAPVVLELAAGKPAGQPLTGRLQLIYRPVERFTLIGGYAAGPLFPYCAVGWITGGWNMGWSGGGILTWAYHRGL